MIPVNPINFEAFVDDCRAGGFSPAEALMFYDELKRFAPTCLLPVEDNLPEAASWRHLRQHALAGGLQEVKTIEAFEAYRLHWVGARSTLATAGTPVNNEDPSHLEILNRHVPRDEWINRLSGMTAFRLPKAWQAWKAMGVTWNDVQGALDADRLHLPAVKEEIPSGLTQEQAQHALEEAIAATGLAGVRWPLVSHSPTTMWVLAKQIRQCAQELASHTGGTLEMLGLGGRIELDVGGESKYGGCADTNYDYNHSTLSTSPSNPWGVLSHEWLHALDGFLNKSKVKASPARQKTRTAWEQVQQMFDSSPTQPSPSRIATFKALLEQGWGDCPHVQEQLEGLNDNLSWSKQDKQNLLAAIRKDKAVKMGADDETAQMRAIVDLTDLQLIQQGLSAETPSLWKDFGREVGLNASLLLSLNDEAEVDYWRDYFSSTKEKYAYSFEATLPVGSLSSDAPTLPTFRYPQGIERSTHELGWKRFFRAAKPWINELCQSAPVFLQEGLEESNLKLEARV